jgi:formate hydrogenlyase transcriptional activator
MNADDRLELFFSQSLDGFFFMMLDEPVRWDDSVDKEKVLDYVFDHQRVTKVNDALLAQYGATRESFLGTTPTDLFRHDLDHGRQVWRDFFDRGRLHVETDERRVDGTALRVEGDYICFYDAEGRITGHFGIQRDVTQRERASEALRQANRRLQVLRDIHLDILGSRSPQQIAQATLRHLQSLIACRRASVAVFDLPGGTGTVIAVHDHTGTQEVDGSPVPIEAFGLQQDLQAGLIGSLRTLSPPGSRAKEEPVDNNRGVMHLPLLAHGDLIGVLNVSADDDRVFGPEAIEIAQEVAGSLAIATRQAQLSEQVERYARKRAEELESQNIYLQEEIKVERSFGEVVGESPAMRRVLKAIALVAETDSTVLLLGETGTGKELTARAIHNLSRRRDAVMVKVNCGALPSGLAESELFGHERGAFTGAVQQKKGRFELAHNGTIFLDEVGELSADVQVKLLRVLQEQEFERLGSTRPTKVNVRVIAATNRDLQEEVAAGRFRSDLFYRLNIFPIHLPALRERAPDVPILAAHFVNEFARRMGKRVERIDAQAATRLSSYAWPGNVRELANVLERAVILCDGPVILDEHLGVLSRQARGSDSASFLTLEEMERQHILRALAQTGGVLAGPQGAARLLGMSRSTIWSRMRKLGIQAPRT